MTLHLGISERCRGLADAVIGWGLLGVIAVSPAAARPQEVRTADTDRWAVVSAPGTLVRDQGAASVKHISTSWYHVVFDNSVSDCVSVATPGNPGGGLPPKGQVTAGFGNLEITVHTDDSTGNKVDFGFHLLVLCPSGSRSAATRSEGPRSESPPEMRTTTTDRWAVVNKDGTLVRGAGVASLARLGTGAYEVIFNKNVSQCVYVAAIGLAVTGIVPPAGEIGVAARGNNQNGVYIRTRNSDGASADRPFHLFVGCEAVRGGSSGVWAAVKEGGTLALGSGVVSSARLGEGAYEVIFDRNVRSCVYIATLARDRQNFGYPVGEISTAPRGNNTNGVYIRTWFTSGEKYDRSFHLYVGCA